MIVDQHPSTISTASSSLAVEGTFVVKVTIDDGENGPKKIIRISLKEICDAQGLPVFDSLVSAISKFASAVLARDMSGVSVSLTYSDEDDDCVHVINSHGLLDAIDQRRAGGQYVLYVTAKLSSSKQDRKESNRKTDVTTQKQLSGTSNDKAKVVPAFSRVKKVSIPDWEKDFTLKSAELKTTKNTLLDFSSMSRRYNDKISTEIEKNYGSTIAMSSDGNCIAVGFIRTTKEREYDEAGKQVVRVYARTDHGNKWAQRGADIVRDSECFDHSVSISSDGRILVVGYTDGLQAKVVIACFSEEEWHEIDDAIADISGLYFHGIRVCLSANGKVLAVHASRFDHVHVFQHKNNTWAKLGRSICGKDSHHMFGHSVSLSSNGMIIAIGCPDADYSGQVRVCEYVKDGWRQKGHDIIGEERGDFCGWSVSLSSCGNFIAVGSPTNMDPDMSGYGSTRVYSYDGEFWRQLGDEIYGKACYDQFGYSVALSSNASILAVGSPMCDFHGENTGGVRTFKYDKGKWIRLANELVGKDRNYRFGHALCLSANGRTLVSGSPGSYGIRSSESDFCKRDVASSKVDKFHGMVNIYKL